MGSSDNRALYKCPIILTTTTTLIGTVPSSGSGGTAAAMAQNLQKIIPHLGSRFNCVVFVAHVGSVLAVNIDGLTQLTVTASSDCFVFDFVYYYYHIIIIIIILLLF